MNNAELIQQSIQKWDGKIPNMVMPSGYSVMDLCPISPEPSLWLPVLKTLSVYLFSVSIIFLIKIVLIGTEKKSC